MISVFQIYYDEKSKACIDPYFYGYENKRKDGFFENTAMRDIYEIQKNITNPDDYIGVSSWKMNIKTNLTGKEIIDFIQKDIDAGAPKDVYIYSPLPKPDSFSVISINPSVIEATIKAPDLWNCHKLAGQHPFDADELLNNAKVLPFDLFHGKWIYCTCNYFICKQHIFNEYCEKVLIPFIDFFNREDIKAHPASVAWYQHSPDDKKYPSYSWVGEGLFGSFLAHRNYTYSYICKKRINRSRRFEMINIKEYQIINS